MNANKALDQTKEHQDNYSIKLPATTDHLESGSPEQDKSYDRAYKYMVAENNLIKARNKTPKNN